MDEPAAQGAPAPSDADEFAHIPTPRSRHPALAAAAILLAGYLIVHKRADIVFAMSSSAPSELGEARAAFSAGAKALPENRLVSIAGTPDRQTALFVDTKGSWKFSQLFRVFGTGDRLFVHRMEGPLPADRATHDVFVGRLLRLQDLPYADSIRDYYSRQVIATHFFRGAELLAAAGKPDAVLKDLAGDAVSLRAADVLALDVLRPGVFRVEVPRERIPDEPGARAAVERAGATEIATVLGRADMWCFEVRVASEARDRVLAALGDIDSRTSLRAARDVLKVRLPDLGVDAGELTVADGKGGIRRIAAADLLSARTLAGIDIPADAWFLVEGEMPRAYLPTLVVCLALVGFALVNVLGLRRALAA